MGKGRGMDDGAITCGLGCFALLFIIAAGLVGGSFQIIEPNEYGLLYNTISKEFQDDRVYSSGRYFVGLAKGFIKYPRSQRNMFFGASKGADRAAVTLQLQGAAVTIECGLQYSLPPTKLMNVYRKYGSNYHSRYVNLAASTLQKVFVDYGLNTTTFYTDRALVSSIALANLTSAFTADNAMVHGFQLRKTSLPATVENSINSKQITEQKTLTELNVQAQENIKAQTTVVIGQTDQDIALFRAGQAQIAKVVTERANADAKNITLAASGIAYQNLKNTLQLDNAGLLEYLYLKSIKQLPDTASVALDFQKVTGARV